MKLSVIAKTDVPIDVSFAVLLMRCYCRNGFHSMAPYGCLGSSRGQKLYKLRSSRGPGRSAANARREDGDDLNCPGQGTDDVDAGYMDQFTELLKAQFHITAGQQFAHRHAGRRLNKSIAQLINDTPLTKQLCERYAAGPG